MAQLLEKLILQSILKKQFEDEICDKPDSCLVDIYE